MHENLILFKIFVNFVKFSCLIFWAQNVQTPPERNVSMSLDQYMCIACGRNINNGNIQTFWQRKLCITIKVIYIVQSLYEFG